MDFLTVYMRGPQVLKIFTAAHPLRMIPSSSGELNLEGLDTHFRFAPYGLEVEVDMTFIKKDTDEHYIKKTWISFPYDCIDTIIRTPLTDEEMERYFEMYPEVRPVPIGFTST